MPARARVVNAFLKQAERVAARPVPDLGFMSTELGRSAKARLASTSPDTDDDSAQSKLGARSVLGYLDGLEALDANEFASTIVNLVPFALERYHSNGWTRGLGRRDQALANTLFLLGKEYLKYARWSVASELFYYGTICGPDQKQSQRSGVLGLICAFRSEDPALMKAFLSQFEGVPKLAAPLARVVEVLKLREIEGVLPKDPQWLDPVKSFGVLTWALVSEIVADGLIQEDRFHEAILLANRVLGEIPNGPERWLRAAILQKRAVAFHASGLVDEALEDSLLAWDLSQSLRYGECDHLLRQAAWNRYLESRIVSFACATSLNRAGLVATLLEHDRLQASLVTQAAPITPKAPEALQVANSASPNDALGSQTESESTAPSAFFTLLNDALGSTRLSLPQSAQLVLDVRGVQDDEGDAVLRHIEWWLGLARYGQSVYWSLVYQGTPVDCGQLVLSQGEFLAGVLDDLDRDASAFISLGNAAGGGAPTIDPWYHLSEWGTAEERMVSGTLAQLLPSALLEAVRAASSSQPIELVIASGAGLSRVPWPILNIAIDGQNHVRLIERATLRHWMSSTVEASKRASAARAGTSSGSVPLLVAIDDPGGGLVGSSEVLRERASAYFDSSSSAQEPNHDVKAVLLESIRDLCATHPIGTFFYRGHAQSTKDPAYSVLELPTSTTDDGDDDYLSSGEIFARLEDGTPWVPMPSRVILSCCSSSSAALFGGETIGLAAACILGGGAWEVVATAVDVYDSSFTTAFDDMLAQEMTSPESHDQVLRALQIRMYDEWKIFSVRGGISVEEDITFPHPMVWAMYQAI